MQKESVVLPNETYLWFTNQMMFLSYIPRTSQNIWCILSADVEAQDSAVLLTII